MLLRDLFVWLVRLSYPSIRTRQQNLYPATTEIHLLFVGLEAVDSPELDVVLLLARGQLGDGGRYSGTGTEGADAPRVHLNKIELIAAATTFVSSDGRTEE